jgi:hypothetical protein
MSRALTNGSTTASKNNVHVRHIYCIQQYDIFLIY